MSKKNKTRKTTSSKIQVLIDIAKVELLNKGISRFNYEKVIKSAGLSKSTVYEKYGKKEDFIIFLIKSILDELYISFKKYVDELKNFDEILEYISNLNFDIESILKEYPIDDFFTNKRISTFVNNYFYQTYGQVIVNKIIEFQKQNEVRNDIDAIYILEFLISVTKGMGFLLKNRNFKEVVTNYRKLIENALKPIEKIIIVKGDANLGEK
ncbi:MAG: TetR/AcrR family transcriptional regulator [Defluviitoga tunisiensis]|jgi:AcrR family transcriptional regulator|uniref:Transcriptional regulator n=1 Tax=Defluviitoga tunisiensis TaxID=1006576 RepID=A0A0C7P4E0_DEFTU|nr:TetR/AcrR family transcriptional regulator [Defluviitoga tunisiensis]MDD3600178.1 TetR/AcrR family transcriptional regulator [Defluviitoga tunisiensis]MDY0379557.1 TetR/AcrR family transcriptional regulator [Defluviitoga tunisiensis]CEP78724.1 transcriptional regulator [Defluviitoga tunisiensis]HHV01948.1 TetR/AcrR family transcriptional regulator [Defluviitoga tunisiensis]HOB54666.1 TetR/AcrR family transcriptional regulator [Defluviitoga tunisiensis]